jgi:hypothetical protein
MDGLTKAYSLKEGSVALPTTYMGAGYHQHTFNNAVDLEPLDDQCLLIHISSGHLQMLNSI